MSKAAKLVAVAVLCGLAALPAADRKALAQAGSIGGTVGKDEKTISGGAEAPQSDASPSAATPPAPSNNTSGPRFRTSDNQDLDGADLLTVKNVDLDGCTSACSDDQRCQAFSFDKWNRYCFLKSTIAALRLDPRSITGIRRELPTPMTATNSIQMERYRNKSFPGSGYKFVSLARFEACETTCQQEQACIAFTFQKAEQICRLFNSTGEYFGNTQTDSGIKRQPPP